jgi:hypothetical protein
MSMTDRDSRHLHLSVHPTVLASTARSAHAPFFLWALGWLSVSFLASRGMTAQPLPVVIFSVIALAIPVALAGAYGAAISQIRRLSYYKEGGWAYSIFSRRLLASLLWLIWAIPSSFIMLLQFSLLGVDQWIALTVSPIVYIVVFQFIHRINTQELRKPYMALSISVKYASYITPLIMTVGLTLAYVMIGKGDFLESLRENIEMQRASIDGNSKSSIIDYALRILTLADGAKQYLATKLSTSIAYLPAMVSAFGMFIVFFNASLTYSFFVIPKIEYRRVFGVPSEDDPPLPIERSRFIMIAATSTFLVLFAYVPFVGQIETTARNNPEIRNTLGKAEQILVETIDSEKYKPGTIRKIKSVNTDLLARLNAEKAALDANIDKAFFLMDRNVESYLDWYYSLGAEYMRIGQMLTGQLESYMQTKLEEYLSLGNPTADLHRTIETALENQQGLKEEAQRLRQTILDENRVLDSDESFVVSSSASLDSLLTIPNHIDLVALDQRIAGGTVAAGIGGLIAGKIASKAIFKGAAKALLKAAAAKVGGTSVGGAVGAFLGSAVPGVGTVVGGFIGGLIGGVAVDAALLKLDEAVSRDEFRREILSVIAQSREDFKKRLVAAP